MCFWSLSCWNILFLPSLWSLAVTFCTHAAPYPSTLNSLLFICTFPYKQFWHQLKKFLLWSLLKSGFISSRHKIHFCSSKGQKYQKNVQTSVNQGITDSLPGLSADQSGFQTPILKQKKPLIVRTELSWRHLLKGDYSSGFFSQSLEKSHSFVPKSMQGYFSGMQHTEMDLCDILCNAWAVTATHPIPFPLETSVLRQDALIFQSSNCKYWHCGYRLVTTAAFFVGQKSLYFPAFLKPKIRFFFCHFFVKSSPHGAKMLPRRHSGTLELKGAVSFASVITDSLTHSTFRPIFFNLNTITDNRNFSTYQHKISIMSERRVAHHRPCGCTLMRLEVRTHT